MFVNNPGKVIKKYLRKLVYLFTFKFYIKPGLNRRISVKLGGFIFTVYPTVFNLRYSVSSKVFASYINTLDLHGKTILDMGCGCGVVSIFAASKGAECVAVDINPMAVKSAMENAESNGFMDKIKVVEGDLFDSSPDDNPTPALPKGEGVIVPSPLGRVRVGYKMFDIIFFNPPYYRGIPENDFERAFKGGENYDVIYRFLSNAKKYLKKDGYICMIISSDMGIEEFTDIAKKTGYSYEIVTKINKFFETFYIINLV